MACADWHGGAGGGDDWPGLFVWAGGVVSGIVEGAVWGVDCFGDAGDWGDVVSDEGHVAGSVVFCDVFDYGGVFSAVSYGADDSQAGEPGAVDRHAGGDDSDYVVFGTGVLADGPVFQVGADGGFFSGVYGLAAGEYRVDQVVAGGGGWVGNCKPRRDAAGC